MLSLLALLLCFTGCVKKPTPWPEDQPLPTSFDDFSGFDELDLTKPAEEILADARELGYVVIVEDTVDEDSHAIWKKFMETTAKGRPARVKTLSYGAPGGSHPIVLKEIVYSDSLYYAGWLNQTTGQVEFRTVKRYLAGGVMKSCRSGASDCDCKLEQYCLTDLSDFNLEEYWNFYASTTVETDRDELYLHSYIVYFVNTPPCQSAD